jgi:hypothetical protein
MSTLRLTTISNQTGSSSVPSETVINGSAKAWVNFNGTGTVAIRASFNVSSITDNGTGNYTVNFTTALADGNYSVVGGVIGNSASYAYMTSGLVTPSASSVVVITGRFDQSSGTFQDLSQCNVAVFR